MASRNGKRKIAKSKAGRGSKMRQMDMFEDGTMSDSASLMTEQPTAPKRSSRPSLRLIFGLGVGACIVLLVITGIVLVSISNQASSDSSTNEQDAPAELWKKDPAYGLSTDEVFLRHRATSLTSQALRDVANAVNVQSLKDQELAPLLIPRVPDTTGSQQARDHIVGRLANLGGWGVELNTFRDKTPYGQKSFTNIIATANPNVKRRLVLACHYDSKYYPESEGTFIGATDSALPCAQILYLAKMLNNSLKQANATNPPVTLQLIFFDGEEAFVRWTSKDSIYGARHLAKKMSLTAHPPGAQNTNLLHGMDMFILLDLLGARNPSIPNFFRSTSTWYNRMANIEQRLKRAKLTSRYNRNYFNGNQRFGGGIQDDHIPFLEKGVRILHLIPSPFPSVWHTMQDNAAALDDATIQNLSKILHVFVAEYLSLPV
ncbi:glutaminyl-peptide cyclotransferase-like [Diadema antillarum]|uniref:glutaminyl-peptide cyclotransferase-like n=1 Tax=Diadema antillarum TaxID=105358 RepID=UPI003A86C7B9